MARPMPASPHANSSLAIGIIRPPGSKKHWVMKSKEYKPIRAASSMIGHGVSSRSSHSWAAGRMTSSAKSWTHFWICSWSSLRSSENSDISSPLPLGPSTDPGLSVPVSVVEPKPAVAARAGLGLDLSVVTQR